MTNYENFDKTIAALRIGSLEPKTLDKTMLWNRYLTVSSNESAYLKQQTFVNIIFFNQTPEEIKIGPDHKCLINEVYPNNLRPFGRYWLPTPNNIQKILNMRIDDDELEVFNAKNLPFYPNINRVCHNQNVCTEELKIESLTVGEIEFNYL